MSNETILLVDDDVNILDTAKDILEEAGYEISTASTGAKAVELLDKKAFNVVVADFQLPDAELKAKADCNCWSRRTGWI